MAFQNKSVGFHPNDAKNLYVGSGLQIEPWKAQLAPKQALEGANGIRAVLVEAWSTFKDPAQGLHMLGSVLFTQIDSKFL